MKFSNADDTRALLRGFERSPEDPERRCLYCERTFEQGVVYPVGDRLFDADRAAQDHLERDHGGAFAALLGQGREVHGLSDIQAQVLAASYEGLSDQGIAGLLGGRSVSTVRNHRFQLRRRQREARALLALMDLLERQLSRGPVYVQFHPGLPVSDDRTLVTEDEADKMLGRYFEDPARTRLSRFPKKQKAKLVVLRRIVERLTPGRRYTEPEVNQILSVAHDDHVTLRRYLVDYRFLAREPDGSAYWRIDGPAAAASDQSED